MARFYDVSRPVFEGMPVYQNRPGKQPKLEVVRDFAGGEGVRETRLHLDAHTGTHLDAPLHVIPGGGTVDRLEPERLLGHCRVLDLTHVRERIEQRDLAGEGVAAGDFVLLKTRNSLQAGFDPAFVYLSAAGAVYLAAAGVRGVGIDALGVEREQPGHPTHRTLFQAGVLVLEGLDLGGVPAGEYFLVLAPLPLVGTEAAPARVFLLELGKEKQAAGPRG